MMRVAPRTAALPVARVGFVDGALATVTLWRFPSRPIDGT